jgi:hypothetical protein
MSAVCSPLKSVWLTDIYSRPFLRVRFRRRFGSFLDSSDGPVSRPEYAIFKIAVRFAENEIGQIALFGGPIMRTHRVVRVILRGKLASTVFLISPPSSPSPLRRASICNVGSSGASALFEDAGEMAMMLVRCAHVPGRVRSRRLFRCLPKAAAKFGAEWALTNSSLAIRNRSRRAGLA